MRAFVKRLLAYVVAVCVLALLVVAGMRLRERRARAIDSVPAPDPHRWAVRTSVVRRETVSEQFPCLATVSSASEVTVSGQLPGTILEMGPREGVAVKQGDLLARIDTREVDEQLLALEARIDAATIAAQHADKELEREKDLLAVGGSTGSRVEEMRTEAVAAHKKVQTLQRQERALAVRRGFARVTAPADAVVAARLAEPGDVCSPAHPLYRLTLIRGARLSVRLPQVILERVHAGTKVVLRHGAQDETVQLSRVFPQLDARALGTAEGDLPALPFGLPSGARVAARVVLDEHRDALVVPLEALLRETTGPRAHVFRVRDSRVERVPVTILLDAPQGAAVSGELAEGERIVVAHTYVLRRLRNGDPVTTDAGSP